MGSSTLLRGGHSIAGSFSTKLFAVGRFLHLYAQRGRANLVVLAALALVCGLSWGQQGDWNESVAAAERDPAALVEKAEAMLGQAERAANAVDELKALRLLSLGYLTGSRLAEHHKIVERGEPLARKLNDAPSLCWFLRLGMQRRLFEQRYELANTLYEEAVDLATRRGLDDCRADIHASRGVAAGTFGRRAQAVESLTAAYAIYERLGDRYHMARSLADLANFMTPVNPSAKDEETAINLMQRAFALTDPSFKRSLHEYHRRLALLYQRRHKYTEAEKAFRAAFEVARDMRSASLSARILLSLGELHMEQRGYALALKDFDEALSYSLAAKLPDALFLVRCHLARAQVLAELGQRSESVEALKSAEALIPQPREASVAALYHAAGARVFERLNDHREAYRHMVAWKQANQSVAAAADAARTDELTVRFGIALKDKDYALLQAQQEQSDARRYMLALALVLTLVIFCGVAFLLFRRVQTAKRQTQFARALAAAEVSANRAKSAFLANLSHEFRSPLNTILGFARLLHRDAQLPAAAREEIGIILKSGEHLHIMINEVLDMAQIEAGRVSFNEQDCFLDQLSEQMSIMFRLDALEKGLEWKVQCDPQVPGTVRTDAVKLRQVLINLVGNAIKFTRRGTVALHIGVTENSADPEACVLRFTVSDTGSGIAPQELEKLGGAFVQGEAGRLAHEGTGLGLALSRNHVRLMGGELKIRSEVGVGTTVEFQLSVRIVNADRLPASPSGRRVIGLAGAPRSWRVVVADDKPEARRVLTGMLLPLGLDVREAANGQEAVDLVQSWEPHLILMDMRMPVMSGLDATRHIRAQGGGRRPAIIAITASSFEEQIGELRSAGCDALLTKPVVEESLLNAISVHLGAKLVYAEVRPASGARPEGEHNAVSLAPEEHQALRQAIQALDTEAVSKALATIGERNAQLAARLSAMAGRYQYAQMIALLDNVPASRPSEPRAAETMPLEPP